MINILFTPGFLHCTLSHNSNQENGHNLYNLFWIEFWETGGETWAKWAIKGRWMWCLLGWTELTITTVLSISLNGTAGSREGAWLGLGERWPNCWLGSLSLRVSSQHIPPPPSVGCGHSFPSLLEIKKQRKIFYNFSARGQNKITVKFEIKGFRG